MYILICLFVCLFNLLLLSTISYISFTVKEILSAVDQHHRGPQRANSPYHTWWNTSVKKLPSFTLGTLRRQGTGRCFLMSGTIAQALHILSRAAMLQFITLLAPQRSQESVTALDIDLQHAAVNYKELLL